MRRATFGCSFVVLLVLLDHVAAQPAADTTTHAPQFVTVEPGVYFPEWGGIRIEDLVVVTEDGIRILTESTKEPWIGS